MHWRAGHVMAFLTSGNDLATRLCLAIGLLRVDGTRFVILLDWFRARPRLLDGRKRQRLYEFHSEGYSRIQPHFVALGQKQPTKHARADRCCACSQYTRTRPRGGAGKYDCPGSGPSDNAATFYVINGLVSIMAAVDLSLLVGPELAVLAPIVNRGYEDSNRFFSPWHCHAIKHNRHLGPFLAPAGRLDRDNVAMEFGAARHY